MLLPSDKESLPIYKNLVEALDPFVDFFLCETMSLAREGKNAVSAARSFSSRSLPVWVAWTLADDGSPGLRSGESIVEAYKAVEPFEPDAFLFNCTDPQAITLGFTQLLELTERSAAPSANRCRASNIGHRTGLSGSSGRQRSGLRAARRTLPLRG